jgi:LDH2 family malate/lactate/ureidoglycolate dehydrogenase
MTTVVQESELIASAAEILGAAGVPSDAATRVADCLVFAERRGTVTHGLVRLKHYCDRLEAGGTAPSCEVQVLRESPATALVDGGNGLGAVVGTRAMEIAIEKARGVGVGLVVARELNHFGAAAYYGLMAAEQGLIGIVSCNVPASMAPTGASQAVVGNNPLSIAFPAADRPPIVWDAATSMSSWGALYLAVQTGMPLTDGAYLGPDGLPTNDAQRVLDGGSLVPIAGYKGYGLALCLGLLTGVLAGARFDAELTHPYFELGTPGGGAALLIAINVGALCSEQEFVGHVESIARQIAGLAPATPGERVWLPGEKEAVTEADRRREGIPLSDATQAEMLELRRKYGLEPTVAADTGG